MTERCPLCDTYPPGVLCHEHTWNDELRQDVHPAVLEARELLVDEERYRLEAQEDALHRMWRCLVLAPNLKIFRALLRGDHVPDSELDQDWLRRFRRRDAA